MQVPSHWETTVVGIFAMTQIQTESHLFVKSVCSRYEPLFFSLTYLIVDLVFVSKIPFSHLDTGTSGWEWNGRNEGSLFAEFAETEVDESAS